MVEQQSRNEIHGHRDSRNNNHKTMIIKKRSPNRNHGTQIAGKKTIVNQHNQETKVAGQQLQSNHHHRRTITERKWRDVNRAAPITKHGTTISRNNKHGATTMEESGNNNQARTIEQQQQRRLADGHLAVVAGVFKRRPAREYSAALRVLRRVLQEGSIDVRFFESAGWDNSTEGTATPR